MKKLFIASFVLLCLSFCTKEAETSVIIKLPTGRINLFPYSSTWSGTASNQGITRAALRYAVVSGDGTYLAYFITGSLPPNTLQLLRKDSLAAYFTSGLNTSYPAYSAKSNNQIVVKSDITLVMTISTSTNAASCTGYSGTQTVYTDVSFSRFYTDAGLTTPFAGNGQYYTWGLWGASIAINSSGYSTSIIFC